MPGYSGTPLPKKLGIKAGFRVQLANAPAEVRAELSDALAECKRSQAGPIALDFVMLFSQVARGVDEGILADGEGYWLRRECCG